MIYSDQVSECDQNGTNRKYKILSGISNTEEVYMFMNLVIQV